MKKIRPLASDKLRIKTDPKQFSFETTAELESLTKFIGQTRALDAMSFGVGIKNNGFNLYAMGPPSVGKLSVVRSVLENKASKQPVPSDWCYIHNFEKPQMPIALELPAGRGIALQKDMQLLIEDLLTTIPSIFESEEYRTRMQNLTNELNERQESMFNALVDDAKQENLLILPAPHGFTVVPTNNKGESLTTEEFQQLPAKKRNHQQKMINLFSERLADFLKQIATLHKERREKEKEAQREFTLAAVGHFIDELKKKYADYTSVVTYLDAVQRDVIMNVKDFLKHDEGTTHFLLGIEKPALTRFQVNVLVDNSQTKGAPIIYEENPTYHNLICRVEHTTRFGTLMTDFNLIRPGALHRANGGYLILDIYKVLTQPFVWDALKRTLFSRKIPIEPVEHLLGLFRTASIEAMPIPLDVKVVLLGDRLTYYMLSELDPEFSELFKVAADFEEEIGRNKENLQAYAQLIATIAKKEDLRPFHRTAVATIIDQSSRLAADTEKLSTHIHIINDLIREANYWAGMNNRGKVIDVDVELAIAAQIHRMSRLKETLYEQVQRDFILIDTDGAKTGQVNGLSVIQLGTFTFGHPSRITARVHMGRGEVIDIQREVKLGGAIHSKGVLILSNFLAGRYIRDLPFSLSASLVFEQTYGLVEGDSASVAELCALLSALADAPINQGLAVTGSINQHGEVQIIGGINEKIEGFFDICKGKGLTGKQGVLIPALNMKHLMLREDVIAAAKAKKFHIYPISTIDEAVTLLTGTPAGERLRHGTFPKNSINHRVEMRLEDFATRRMPSVKKKIKKKWEGK